MDNKKVPCNLALVGSSNSKCRTMENLYKRYSYIYSPSGDVSCVGIGEPGCLGGFSKTYIKEQKAKKLNLNKK